MLQLNNKLDLSKTILEVETQSIISETEIVGFLNEHSERIINPIGANVTSWSFEKNQGIEVLSQFLIMIEGKSIPYRFLSSKDKALIFEQKI